MWMTSAQVRLPFDALLRDIAHCLKDDSATRVSSVGKARPEVRQREQASAFISLG
jgi:hypothetical protein